MGWVLGLGGVWLGLGFGEGWLGLGVGFGMLGFGCGGLAGVGRLVWILGLGVGVWGWRLVGAVGFGGGGVQLKFEHGDVTDGGAGEQEELGTTGFGHRVVVEGEQGWVEGG